MSSLIQCTMRRSALHKKILTRAKDLNKKSADKKGGSDKSKGVAAPVEGVEGQEVITGRPKTGLRLNFKKSTKYRKTSPKTKKTDSKASALSEIEKKHAEWARFASVLLPKIKEPIRTEDELREKRKWDLVWRRKMHISWNRQKRWENRMIKLKLVATDELPPKLRDGALTIDNSRMPFEFIVSRWDLPTEGEVLFGESQRPGYRNMVGDGGLCHSQEFRRGFIILMNFQMLPL